MDAKVMEAKIQHWMPLFEAQASSGLTKDAWCKENGIPRWQFYRRQKEIRKYLLDKNKDASAMIEAEEMPPTLVEIPIDTPTEAVRPLRASKPAPAGQISITYHGFKIDLSGSVDESTLETLIRSIAHV